jgi:hypothetical protein
MEPARLAEAGEALVVERSAGSRTSRRTTQAPKKIVVE